MDTACDKRPSEDVLFRWDQRTHSASFETPSQSDEAFIKRRMTEAKRVDDSHEVLDGLEENEAAELQRLFKESTTDGLNMSSELLHKTRDKREELMKNLKKFQLHSCKDWLGANTHKASVEKVDTLDRLSALIINPEFPMKHEAVLYSLQLGRSDYDFYNALHLTKLSRMSNPSVLELIRQPVFVRNRMLLLTDRKRCDCALEALIKAQAPQRNFLPTRQPNPQSLSSQPSFGHQGSFGDSILNRFMPPHGALSHTLFGGERSYASLFGLDKRPEADRRQEHVDENDLVCPFHQATDLPEALKNPKGLCGVVSHYNLLYKYDEVKLSDRSYHVLSLMPLPLEGKKRAHPVTKGASESSRVYQYKLPSKLVALNHVYLRDFEYERYYSNNNLYNSGHYIGFPHRGRESTLNLSNVYSGDALFMVTKTEILIALLNAQDPAFSHGGLTLHVVMRDKNRLHDVKDVLCHRETGRIFILDSNSLLYEFQYQIGFAPKSLRHHRLLNCFYNSMQYARYLLLNFVRRNKVYNLTAQEPPSERGMGVTTGDHDGFQDALSTSLSNHNCLTNLDSEVTRCTSYYPPLRWSEFRYTPEPPKNLFSSGLNSQRALGPGLAPENAIAANTVGSKMCSCGFGCRVDALHTNFKCINPWNKKFMKTGDSLAMLDERRCLLSLLNTTTGDLSVFHIHGYTTLQEYSKGVSSNERVFPYDLTLYNLKHGAVISALDRMGYNRFSHGSKFVKLLPPPHDFVHGVDLVLVDNLGLKVFVGFSNTALTSSTGLITTSLKTNLSTNVGSETMKIHASNDRPSFATTKVTLAVKGFRMPVRFMSQSPRGPFALFRAKPNVSTFVLEDLFLTMEPFRKVQNGTLVRLIVTRNDSSSFFQNAATLPLSLNEEFYVFNENAAHYRTLEENQPVEYYHEFYVKLEDKEKVVTVYSTKPLRHHPGSEVDGTETHNVGTCESKVDPDKNHGSNTYRAHVTPTLLVLVTTEKVYTFSKLNDDLILKSLVKYPRQSLQLIKPPPLLNGNHSPGNTPSNSLRPVAGRSDTALVKYNPESERLNGAVPELNGASGDGALFDLKDYLKDTNGASDERSYFLKSFEKAPVAASDWSLKSNLSSSAALADYEKYSGARADRADFLRYLANKAHDSDEFFENVFGDDLVEICENSRELVGYSLYYISWLYGPENLFKLVLKYLTTLLTTRLNAQTHLGPFGNALTDWSQVPLPDLSLNVLNGDLLYSYLFANHSDDYNVFIGSFGIPCKIFNYVVPGCYSVLEGAFTKPVVSPWCRFVAFAQNNKLKHSRAVTNTSPLVDGLLLLVSELLEPMYYSRIFDLVPQLYNNTLTNPTVGPPAPSTPTSPTNLYSNNYASFNNRSETRYLMDELELKRLDNMNEFVLGTRVDMHLGLELAMGHEKARKLLQSLFSLHLIVFELVRSYQSCNLDNVVSLMSTLAPNVLKMMLSPNSNQHEPYPPAQGSYFFEAPVTSTNARSFFSSTGERTEDLSKEMLSQLAGLVRDRYANDLRTLQELTTVLQVAQEFLASAMLLHDNAVLGEFEYDFDKKLNLVNLLPAKSPGGFFSPLDFNLNWRNDPSVLSAFSAKFTGESPKTKLVLTKDILHVVVHSNLLNLFLNPELFRLFRIVVWLSSGNVAPLQRHFFGHIFTLDEVELMSNCHRVKFLQRQFESTQDAAKSEYLGSLIRQFSAD